MVELLCRFSKRTFGAAALAALLGLAVFGCSPARDTPLISSEEFGTPTAVPTPTATRLPEEAVQIAGQRTSDAQTALDVVGKDIIKIANWNEGGPAMLNSLLGYFMVWGFDYTVELVEMEREDYRDALEKGEVDLVLHVDTADADTAEWLSSVVDSGTVLEGGKPLADTETVLIAVHPTLMERAPDLVNFLSTTTLPGGEFSRIAGMVKFGRVGVNPGAGAFKYLKEQGAVWNTWVPTEEASKGPGGDRCEQDLTPQPDVYSARRRGQRLRAELVSVPYDVGRPVKEYPHPSPLPRRERG